MYRTIAFACSLLSVCALAADKSWQEPPAATCVITENRPKIDGQLTDSAWKTALKLGPFTTPYAKPAKGRTTALVGCDGANLYLGIRCAEPNMAALTATKTKRDSAIYTEDCVEIFIDANYDFHTYRHFLVSAANTQRDEDCCLGRSPLYNTKWNAKWQSAVQRGAKEWTVEAAIPLKALGIDAAKDRVIGLNICRSRIPDKELSVWVPTDGGFHRPSRFGTVLLTRSAAPARIHAKVTWLSPAKVGIMTVKAEVRNASKQPVVANCQMRVASAKASAAEDLGQFEWGPGQRTQPTLRFAVREPGPQRVGVVLTDAKSGQVLLAKSIAFDVSLIVATKPFGKRIDLATGYALWWCESTYKVMKNTAAPAQKADAVQISAAGREFEPFQIVIRSKNALKRVTASVSDFKCGEHAIAASNFKVHRVEYVPVTMPSDSFGFKADWPDPLPVLEGKFDVKPNENQPLWVLAYVPAGTPAGEYLGNVRLAPANGKAATIPVKLTVYNFTLTEETHTKTAYGVGVNSAFLGLKTDEQRDKVYDLYLQSARDHRISPYSPMALHRIKQTLNGPQRRFKCGDLELVLDEYSANYFEIYVRGKQIGALHNTMTQFERKGVGYKGTGVNWPGVTAIKAVKVVERSPQRWVVDVTGVKQGSGPARRQFEATFRFTIPADGSWFSARMLRLVNTDKVKFEARGYFYILRSLMTKRKQVRKKHYSYWLGEKAYLGVADVTGQAGLGLGAIYVRTGARWLEPGQAIDVEQPELLFFAGRGGQAEADAVGKRMAAILKAGGAAKFQPKADAKIAVVEKTQPTVDLDFTDFDRAAHKYLDEWKFNAFNFPAMPGSFGPHRRFGPEFKRLHKIVCGKMVEHLRQKGWLAKAYSYWYDEPSEDDYPYVIQGMDLLAADCPGLTRLLTEQPEPALAGHVDLWVPVLSRYKPEDGFERQAAGDRVWWYVCCGPRAPYPNNFIDHPAINHRIRFWMQEKYGVTGSLYWSTTYWWGKGRKLRSPWDDGMSVNPSGGHWGNGDGMLLYPACRKPSQKPVLKGPVASMRWELLREGLEDREYFWTLRQELDKLRQRVGALNGKALVRARFAVLQAERALGAADRLAKSLTEYTKDPQDLFDERQRLARAIELCRE